jgi:hypothetical protein
VTEELGPGIYEALVTEGLRARLDALADATPATTRALASAEAPDRIAWHLSRQIERALNDVTDTDRVIVGLQVARALLATLGELVTTDPQELPVNPAQVLHAIQQRRPDGSPQPIEEPLIPLLDTTLLTNAPGEPGLWSQLRSEIESADAIDVVMAFIRRSGIAPLLDNLRRHCEHGKPLRILTTTYTGSTEGRALDQLAELGAEVRISYDLGSTSPEPRPRAPSPTPRWSSSTPPPRCSTTSRTTSATRWATPPSTATRSPTPCCADSCATHASR